MRPVEHRSEDSTGDEGMTLAEITVTMTIMSVLMLVFTGAILQVYRTLNTTEVLSVAQAQLQTAFKRLDKEIRYASWIAAPSQSAPYYVEFALPPATKDDDNNGVPDDADADGRPDTYVPCRQLRLDSGVLQLLAWRAGSPPAAGQKGQTLASNLVANDTDTNPKVAAYPFVLQLAGDKPYANDANGIGTDYATEYYRLRIRLTTKLNSRYIRSDIAFTAMNTSRENLDDPIHQCAEGRP